MQIEQLKKELSVLIKEAEKLTKVAEAEIKLEPEKRMVHIIPAGNYQSWYSRALRVITQIIPERRSDFEVQYNNPKRTKLERTNYSISDYYNGRAEIRIYEKTKDTLDYRFYLLFIHQSQILAACSPVFESSVSNISTLAKADVLDSELSAARELLKNNYFRAAGVVAGVVLESHLSDLCSKYSALPKKKDPGINDLATALQTGGNIDTIQWRKLQSLADVRNLCGHKKTREPKSEEVLELIDGVNSVIKTLF